MKTKFERFRIVTLLAGAALFSGCQAILEDLAREPYHDALRKGRLSPTEYMRISEQIDQAANPPTPAGRIPDKYK